MEIIRPTIPESEDDLLQLRAKLNEPKNRFLCIIINFLSSEQPTRMTDLLETVSTYYRESYDKSTIYQAIHKLKCLGITNFESYMEATHKNSEIHKEIVRKHRKFLYKQIPKNFHNRYHQTKYYFLTDKGMKLIEWTCKILGFKIKDE